MVEPLNHSPIHPWTFNICHVHVRKDVWHWVCRVGQGWMEGDLFFSFLASSWLSMPSRSSVSSVVLSRTDFLVALSMLMVQLNNKYTMTLGLF